MLKRSLIDTLSNFIISVNEFKAYARPHSKPAMIDLFKFTSKSRSIHKCINDINFKIKRQTLMGKVDTCFNHNFNSIKFVNHNFLQKSYIYDCKFDYEMNVNLIEENQEMNRDTDKFRRKKYDVFLSHANADKLDYVEDLVDAIKRLDIKLFYDKDELSWGDNWKDSIWNGTKEAEFVIVVISENFFGRKWTEFELREFLKCQSKIKQKIILPILYNIDFDNLKNKYPELEFIQAIEAHLTSPADVAILLAKELIKRYR